MGYIINPILGLWKIFLCVWKPITELIRELVYTDVHGFRVMYRTVSVSGSCLEHRSLVLVGDVDASFEHCKTKVTKTTFYRHRAKFFDKETNKWKRFPRAVVESSSSECDSVEMEVADDLNFRIVEGELP